MSSLKKKKQKKYQLYIDNQVAIRHMYVLIKVNEIK